MPPGARRDIIDPKRFGIHTYEDLTIPTRDGETLHGWLIRTKKQNRPTMVCFHGNAGNISHRLPIMREFVHLEYNVVYVSYRGYGLSSGTPSERGLQTDALSAFDFVFGLPDIDPQKVFVYGQSLGGAVAVSLAAQRAHKIAGLILENTFTSIPDMVDVIFPLLSFAKPLLTSVWGSSERVGSLEIPVLMLSALNDEIVPARMMAQLWDILRKNPKAHSLSRFIPFPGAQHNVTWMETSYFPEIRKFVDDVLALSQ
eukprot:TRINITY_DN5608_c1_g1_i1.p1 TRINITY_DN5608_c1_g1~~TRINITY_DN5608_c1_g1_i1.p1  ORF type:complete len:293 (+),score=40.39 TRINITY_DN5608_c1_g1_i1:114-881(+)